MAAEHQRVGADALVEVNLDEFEARRATMISLKHERWTDAMQEEKAARDLVRKLQAQHEEAIQRDPASVEALQQRLFVATQVCPHRERCGLGCARVLIYLL